MGILNITPDSFYDGSSLSNKNSLNYKISRIESSDIIDIGAESSRPGSKPITISKEIDRLKMINIKKIKSNFISIDSYKYEVIDYALNNGCNMINDITAGGINYKNIELAIKFNVPIILMHMQGNPESMQINPKYDNLIDNILSFFDSKINYSIKMGLKKEQIILDPGVGFGKSVEDNYMIIKSLDKIKKMGFPILIGVSRKSFLSQNNDTPNDRLLPSLIMGAIASMNGADILRVHDVRETKNILNVVGKYVQT